MLDIVDQIPRGFVLGYGDVAEMIGSGGPRQVGQVMARYGHLVAWHRVIYGNGRLPSGHEVEAAAKLRAEGVRFRAPTTHGHEQIDMTQHRWQGAQ